MTESQYLTVLGALSILKLRITSLSGPAAGSSTGIETLNAEDTVRDDRQ